jgi:cobalt-zinc-cadmium efflux system outer membrane protein
MRTTAQRLCMKHHSISLFVRAIAALLVLAPALVPAQQALTWDQVRAKFEETNPTLKADALGVDEMKAEEITAFLRPNPQFTMLADGTQIVPHDGVGPPSEAPTKSPASVTCMSATTSANCGLKAPRKARRLPSRNTRIWIAPSSLPCALRLSKPCRPSSCSIWPGRTLDYYDKIIQISRDRFRAGDIAQIDLDRIELLRVQYESEIQNAIVNLRTAKIQLLQLLNDRTPVDQFDVDGPYDFSEDLAPLEDFRNTALDARPDLRAALQSLQQADTNHKLAEANGSTDPTFGAWYTHNSSNNNPNGIQTLGLSVSIPLRIFDKNQGEKKRTQIDIGKNQQLTEASRAQVFSDVDSAYEIVRSNIALLKPYKAQYNAQALRVRDTVTYSYEHGGASLMDFLNAQSDYRTVQLAYAQLIGAYLTAAGQLNLAVGREVIQ